MHQTLSRGFLNLGLGLAVIFFLAYWDTRSSYILVLNSCNSHVS